MLIRNITDKTRHPKSLSLTSEIRLAPGEAVDSEKLTKHPGWISIEPLIGMGLLAYEEAPPKPAPKKAAPKKQSKGDAEYYARQFGGKLEQKIIGRLLNKEVAESNKLEELVGKPITEAQFDEAAGKKDACYYKVKARYDVWPSAYASGALVKCRKVGAKNWGNSKKK